MSRLNLQYFPCIVHMNFIESFVMCVTTMHPIVATTCIITNHAQICDGSCVLYNTVHRFYVQLHS